MQKRKLKTVVIGAITGVVLLGICARLFIFTEPIIITESYIEIRPYTASNGESISKKWGYIKEDKEDYQIMYKGEKLPSKKGEDYIYVDYGFDLQRNSISGCSNIEIIYEKFNEYSERFLYSFKTLFPTRLDMAEVKTNSIRSIVMYVGGLSKEEIEEAVRGAELSLLYTINGKTEKMACPINENTPVYFVKGVEDDEEE